MRLSNLYRFTIEGGVNFIFASKMAVNSSCSIVARYICGTPPDRNQECLRRAEPSAPDSPEAAMPSEDVRPGNHRQYLLRPGADGARAPAVAARRATAGAPELSGRAINVLKMLADELMGEVPPRGRAGCRPRPCCAGSRWSGCRLREIAVRGRPMKSSAGPRRAG